jgi:hypothetical protein
MMVEEGISLDVDRVSTRLDCLAWRLERSNQQIQLDVTSTSYKYCQCNSIKYVGKDGFTSVNYIITTKYAELPLYLKILGDSKNMLYSDKRSFTGL